MKKDNLARVREVAKTYAVTKPFENLKDMGEPRKRRKRHIVADHLFTVARGKGGSGRNLAV